MRKFYDKNWGAHIHVDTSPFNPEVESLVGSTNLCGEEHGIVPPPPGYDTLYLGNSYNSEIGDITFEPNDLGIKHGILSCEDAVTYARLRGLEPIEIINRFGKQEWGQIVTVTWESRSGHYGLEVYGRPRE